MKTWNPGPFLWAFHSYVNIITGAWVPYKISLKKSALVVRTKCLARKGGNFSFLSSFFFNLATTENPLSVYDYSMTARARIPHRQVD